MSDMNGAATLFLEVNTTQAMEAVNALERALKGVGVKPVKVRTDEATQQLKVLETELGVLRKELTASQSAMSQQSVALSSLKTKYQEVSTATSNGAKSTALFTESQIAAHSAARGLSGALGQLWLTYGQLAPLLAGAAIGSGFLRAAKDGSEFAYQLTFVKALGGETAQSISGISKAALDLSKTSLYGPVELANGLRILSQAGLSAKESIEALPAVTQLATVGELNMEAAAMSLVGVMNAFSLSLMDLPHIGDMFARAAALSQTSVAGMTEAMKQASVVHDQYGASIEDTAAALTLLAKVNIEGGRAGTAYRNMLKDIYTPSAEAAKVIEHLGIKTKDSLGNLREFPDIMFDLQKVLKQFNSSSQTDILGKLFTERGGKEAVAFLGQTKEKWEELKNSIANSDGFMSKVTAELEQSTKGRFKQALNTMNSNIIDAFDQSEGAVRKLADALLNLADSAEFKSGINTIVNGIASLTTIAVQAAPALFNLAEAWLVFKGIGLVVSGITVAQGALTGLATSIGIVSSIAAFAGGGLTGLRLGLAATTSAAGVAAGATGLGGIGAALTLLANPITWVVAGVGALVYALNTLVFETPKTVEAAQQFIDVLNRQNQKLKESNDLLEKKLRLQRTGVSEEVSSVASQLNLLNTQYDAAISRRNDPSSGWLERTKAGGEATKIAQAIRDTKKAAGVAEREEERRNQTELLLVIEEYQQKVSKIRDDATHEGKKADTSQIESVLSAYKGQLLSPEGTRKLKESLDRMTIDAQKKLNGVGDKQYKPPSKTSEINDILRSEVKTMESAIKVAKESYKTLAEQIDTDVENFTITKTRGIALKYQAEVQSLQAQAASLREIVNHAIKNGKHSEQAVAEGKLREIEEEIRTAQAKVGKDLTKEYQAQAKDVAAYTIAKKNENDEMQFQIDLLGKTTLEVQKLTLARKLQLEYEQKAFDYTVVNGEVKSHPKENQKELDAVFKAAKDRSEELTDLAYEQQRSFTTGWKNAYNQQIEDLTNSAAQAKDIFKSATDSMADAITQFVMTGKINFNSLANTFIAEVVRMQAKAAATGFMGMITSFLGLGGPKLPGPDGPQISMDSNYVSLTDKLLSGSFSANAKGNVFNSPSLSAYSNKVYDTPQPFLFAKGAGIFAEAGPEAIMPLQRGPNGKLGVSGSGSNVIVNVINNAQGTKATQTTHKDTGGKTVIDVVIDTVKSAIVGDIASGGVVSGAMESQYGLNRAAGAWR